MRHGKFRHYKSGIEEVRKRWANEVASAAKARIIADLMTEGWTGDRRFREAMRVLKREAERQTARLTVQLRTRPKCSRK